MVDYSKDTDRCSPYDKERRARRVKEEYVEQHLTRSTAIFGEV